MKNYDRAAIFCFYNEQGIIYADTAARMKELKKSVSYLIIAVNGNVNDRKTLEEIADCVLIRENRGYDAGAYQYALFHPACRHRIECCDELILCNDTFLGPFVPFNDIFDDMQDKPYDFWGLSILDNGLIRHIQSYFLVFRRSIISGGYLFDYFEQFIPSTEIGFAEICHFLESKLFAYLCAKGFRYGSYAPPTNNNIYVDILDYLRNGTPVIKKKFFIKQYNETEFMNALVYIRDHYFYDMDRIIHTIKEQYDITIEKNKLKNYDPEKVKAVKRPYCKSADIILDFLKDKSDFYLFGTGICANHIYDLVLAGHRAVCKGFILSKVKNVNQIYRGLPVFPVEECIDKNIIVALNEANTKQVAQIMGRNKNILYLWD